MRKFFVTLISAFLFQVFFSTAAMAAGEALGKYDTTISTCVDCSVGPQIRRSTTVDLVCIYYEQEEPGPVRFTIKRSGKSPLVVEHDGGRNGSFCRGRKLIESAIRLEICNSLITRVANKKEIRKLLLQKGRQTNPNRLSPVRLWRQE